MIYLRTFFTLGYTKEVIYSIIPCVFTYFEIFEKKLQLEFLLNLVLTFLLAILLFIFTMVLKNKEYFKNVSIALAKAYFHNGIMRLVTPLIVHANAKDNIEIEYNSQKNKVEISNIIVNIFLEENPKDLKKRENLIVAKKAAYLPSIPFRTYINENENKIEIDDFPRPLLSLIDFFDASIKDPDIIRKKTERYYKNFNEAIIKECKQIKDRHRINFNLFFEGNPIELN